MPAIAPKDRNESGRSDRDRIFSSRYSSLLEWAMFITQGSKQAAEDLVHDAYVLFTLPTSDPGDIRNVDGYLYTILKHLHRSSLKRFQRYPMESLSLIDYDSSLKSLMAAEHDETDLSEVQANLWTVCRYFCSRKVQTKSASLILLRFVHGLEPEELVYCVGLRWNAIRQHIHVARTEVKAYLRSPEKFASIRTRGESSVEMKPDRAVSPEVMVQELRSFLFSQHEGACLSAEELLNPPTSHSAEVLAHIVSCESCLGVLRRGYNSSGNPDGGDGRRGEGTVRKLSGKDSSVARSTREKSQAVFRHFPEELQVAINGLWLACQEITSEESRLHLSIPDSKEIAFIEVFSEQHQRLALLYVEDQPPVGANSLRQDIRLSCGRSLSLVVSFTSTGALVNVEYREPLDLLDQISSRTATSRSTSIWGEKARTLLRLVSRRLPLTAFASAVAVSVLIGALIWRNGSAGAPDTAASILASAARTEMNLIAAPGAVHRLVHVQSLAGNGVWTDVGVLESWTDPARRLLARRFTRDGRLLAEELKQNDKSDVWIAPNLQETDKQLTELNIRSMNLWDMNASAEDMRATEPQPVETLDASSSLFYVRLESPRKAGTALQEAVLVVNRASRRVNEETLTFRETGRLVKVRLVPAILEVVEDGRVPPGVFAKSPQRVGEARLHPSHLTAPARLSPDLQVHALYRLNQVGADMRGEVKLTKSDGRLLVSGVLDSEDRLKQIQQALRPLTDRRFLILRLSTGASAKPRTTRLVSEEGESTADRIPMDAQLRTALGMRTLNKQQLNKQVQSFAEQALQRSSAMRQHAWALVTLSRLLSPQEIQSLSPEARKEWLQVTAMHSRLLQEELEVLEKQLDSAFPHDQTTERRMADLEQASELRSRAELLLTHVQKASSIVDWSFTLAPLESRSPGQIDETFWSDIHETKDLAQQISTTATDLLRGAQ